VLLEVSGDMFRTHQYALQTVRPFIFESVRALPPADRQVPGRVAQLVRPQPPRTSRHIATAVGATPQPVPQFVSRHSAFGHLRALASLGYDHFYQLRWMT